MSIFQVFGRFSILFFWIVIQVPLNACSCLDPLPVNQSLNSADLVFAGTVSQLSDDLQHNTREITFEISRVWKGQIPQTVTFDMVLGDSCRYNFAANESYLVYGMLLDRTQLNQEKGYKGKHKLFQQPNTLLGVNQCGRTSFLVGQPNPDGNPDIAELGAGYPPTPKLKTSSLSLGFYVALVCLVNLSLLKVGMVIGRRRKREP